MTMVSHIKVNQNTGKNNVSIQGWYTNLSDKTVFCLSVKSYVKLVICFVSTHPLFHKVKVSFGLSEVMISDQKLETL